MIYSISGKIGSGKDLVAKIIQYLTTEKNPDYQEFYLKYFQTNKNIENPFFEVRKWADKLKDIVCLLLNCTREQLEDRDFKEKELGEEWEVWYSLTISNLYINDEKDVIKFQGSIKDYKKDCLTPRKLLQLIGTECGRNIIHPNLWVNALMSSYGKITYNKCVEEGKCIGNPCDKFFTKEHCDGKAVRDNWIITDTRFPNEFKAVKSKHGKNIRVERSFELKHPELCKAYYKENPKEFHVTDENIFIEWLLKSKNNSLNKLGLIYSHESEISLDKETIWDAVIRNNGTVEELFHQIKEIL